MCRSQDVEIKPFMMGYAEPLGREQAAVIYDGLRDISLLSGSPTPTPAVRCGGWLETMTITEGRESSDRD